MRQAGDKKRWRAMIQHNHEQHHIGYYGARRAPPPAHCLAMRVLAYAALGSCSPRCGDVLWGVEITSQLT